MINSIDITFNVFVVDNTDSWTPNGSALGINLSAVEKAFVRITNKIKSMDVNEAYKNFGVKFDTFKFFLQGSYYFDSDFISNQRYMYLSLYRKGASVKTIKINLLGVPSNTVIEFICSDGNSLAIWGNYPPSPWTMVSSSPYWVTQSMDVDWVQLHDDFVVDFPEVLLPISNWLKMHMLDQKIYNANANRKLIEIREKESNVLVDTVAILGGFITVAGFMKAGAVIAEQPFRDVSNYLKPNTFNEYIMPGVYNSASSYLQNASSILGNINKLSINQANVEALKQSTVADIGNATATGVFLYGAMGKLAKNIVKATLKYGKWVIPAHNFLFETQELGVGSDFSYNGIIYTAKARPVVTQQDNWQFQQTVNTHSSNQATTEATQGTTTNADAQQQADATAQHEQNNAQNEQNNAIKNVLDSLKTAINSQAKSIVDTLKNMKLNLSIPEGSTIPLGFDTQALKDFFTTNKVGIDTSAFQEWLGTHGLNINTTSFQEWLGTHGLNINTTSFQEFLGTHGLNINTTSFQEFLGTHGLNINTTSFQEFLRTHGLNIDVESLQTLINTHGLSIDTTVLQSILQSGLRLNAPNSINLNSPESIKLVSDGLKLGLDDTATESIRAISDTYKTYAEKVEARENERVTREETKETRDSERWEKEKELVQNEIDNKVTNNEILAVQHSLHTTKAEGLNYAERSIRAWVNEHSQVEYTPVDGVTLKKGLKANPQLVHEKSFKDIVLSTGEIDALVKFPDFIKPIIDDMTKEKTEEEKLKGFSDIAKDSRVTGLEALTKIKY